MLRAVRSRHFVERVFRPEEIAYAEARGGERARAASYASAFAAREAFCKASGVLRGRAFPRAGPGLPGCSSGSLLEVIRLPGRFPVIPAARGILVLCGIFPIVDDRFLVPRCWVLVPGRVGGLRAGGFLRLFRPRRDRGLVESGIAASGQPEIR